MTLHRRQNERFVDQSLVRRTEGDSAIPDESVKPVILLTFANDRDDRVRYLRHLAEEARRLRQALEDAERVGLCQVVIRQNATLDDILEIFQDPACRNRVDIFHQRLNE